MLHFKQLRIQLIIALFIFPIVVQSQDYHALNGSSYAGVFSIYNNPASSVNAPFKWDMNILSLQATSTNATFKPTNVFSVIKDSLSRNVAIQGYGKRSINLLTNLELFNFRLSLNDKKAISFGLRTRQYTEFNTTDLTYNNNANSLRRYLDANSQSPALSLSLTHALWLETFANYAQVLVNSELERLSVGATVSILKNISGGAFQLNNLGFQKDPNNPNGYVLNNGTALATYSSNYENFQSTEIDPNAVKNFLTDTKTSFAISFGVEYLIKKPEFYSTEPEAPTNYDWKIGASIIDIGASKFNPSDQSFALSQPIIDNRTQQLDTDFDGATNLKSYKEPLRKYFKEIDNVTKLNFMLPTRLLLSVDKNLKHNFYVNGQLSLNFYSSEINETLKVHELNLITITPRWEKRLLGIYLPIQYTNNNDFWVGAAIKAGPLLLGVHNVNWLSSSNWQGFNGGGYLALHYTPSTKKQKTWYDCPSMP